MYNTTTRSKIVKVKAKELIFIDGRSYDTHPKDLFKENRLTV